MGQIRSKKCEQGRERRDHLEQPHHAALAAARGADERNLGPRLDRERQAVQDAVLLEGGVAEPHVAELDLPRETLRLDQLLRLLRVGLDLGLLVHDVRDASRGLQRLNRVGDRLHT